MLNVDDASSQIIRDLTLPKSQYADPFASKQLSISLVPFNVPRKFGMPIRFIRFGLVTTGRARMPETSVYKYCKPCSLEIEVGLPLNSNMH